MTTNTNRLVLESRFWEIMIFVVFTIFILMVLIVSGWSAVLLLTGEGGGGPLEVIVNALQIQRTL